MKKMDVAVTLRAFTTEWGADWTKEQLWGYYSEVTEGQGFVR